MPCPTYGRARRDLAGFDYDEKTNWPVFGRIVRGQAVVDHIV